MNDVIIADAGGVELRSILYKKFDFEIGDFENTFLITCNRSEWENVPNDARVYIPGTEYGGLYLRLKSDTKEKTVAIGGYTWRGMLQNKYIVPPYGQDYATDSGELNAIIKARVTAAFPNLFTGTTESTGVTVNFRYDRYTSLYDGLKAMLKSAGCRLQLAYDQTINKVVVSAAPIVDYSPMIEYSSDMNANYKMVLDRTGVNHMICLGQGELRNRTVVNLYMDENGVISQNQTFFNEDEIVEVYDYAGAGVADLIQSGTQRMQSNASRNEFSIQLDTVQEVAVGDIVGARDYETGMTMTAPITTKIYQWQDGFEKTEYKLSKDVTVEQTAQTLSLMALSDTEELSAPEEEAEEEAPEEESE